MLGRLLRLFAVRQQENIDLGIYDWMEEAFVRFTSMFFSLLYEIRVSKIT